MIKSKAINKPGPDNIEGPVLIILDEYAYYARGDSEEDGSPGRAEKPKQ
jgi:hypothetical protein